MPSVIDHIDRIARVKNRDVLILSFSPMPGKQNDPFWDFEESETRKKVLIWLDQNQISYCACAGVADPAFMGSYAGSVYLDVPFETTNKDYVKLTLFLENEDETPKIPGVNFGYYPLEMAMKNAFMDAPGYWEQQATQW